jgi:hypothetical protein
MGMFSQESEWEKGKGGVRGGCYLARGRLWVKAIYCMFMKLIKFNVFFRIRLFYVDCSV